MTNTARFGIAKPADSDLVQAGAGVMRAAFDGFDAVITGYSSGTFVSRPAANVSEGRIYRATDVLDASPNGTSYFSDGTAWYSLVLVANKGKTNIVTTETRTNAAYGTLTTPDQVTVTLPTDGLIIVRYQAIWQETVSAAAYAAIFLGANQLSIGYATGAGSASGGIAANTTGGTVNRDTPLSTTSAGGLVSTPPGTSGAVDLTTGEAIGVLASGGARVGGGPCEIEAAAGTYTVSVRFLATSGTVTVRNRKLWVTAEAFS